MLSVHGLVCRAYEPANPRTQNVSQQENQYLADEVEPRTEVN